MSYGGICTGNPDLTDRLTALYSAACAPLSADTILSDVPELSSNDFVLPTAVEELRYVGALSSAGFKLFTNTFELLRVPGTGSADTCSTQLIDALNASPESMVALLTAAGYARRMAFLCTQLSYLCMNTAERCLTGDPTDLLRTIEERVGKGDYAASTEEERALESYLDYTANTRWAQLDIPMKNKVGFKNTTAVISEGGVEEQALKVGEVRRKKQRNPTGFHKFNFKDLGLGDSDMDSDCRRSRTSSARGPASTDGGSTRGSLSCGGATGVPGGTVGALTSRSVSSVGEDTPDDFGGELAVLAHRNSSVLFSFEKERQVIQDEVADPQWEAQQRHQRRYSRIRNRVPTGHPAIMRGPSSDLADIVHDYEKQLSDLRIDSETVENTEVNKHIAPRSDNVDDNDKQEASASTGKRNVRIANL